MSATSDLCQCQQVNPADSHETQTDACRIEWGHRGTSTSLCITCCQLQKEVKVIQRSLDSISKQLTNHQTAASRGLEDRVRQVYDDVIEDINAVRQNINSLGNQFAGDSKYKTWIPLTPFCKQLVDQPSQTAALRTSRSVDFVDTSSKKYVPITERFQRGFRQVQTTNGPDAGPPLSHNQRFGRSSSSERTTHGSASFRHRDRSWGPSRSESRQGFESDAGSSNPRGRSERQRSPAQNVTKLDILQENPSELTRVKEEVTFCHNAVRRIHNVPDLMPDPILSDYAQAWAETLAQKGYSQYSNLPDRGESVLVVNAKTKLTGRQIVETWYKERYLYSYSYPRWRKATCNFTQMVWKSSTSVGVGVAKFPYRDTYVVVVQYHPSGNTNRPEEFIQNVLPPINKITHTTDNGFSEIKVTNELQEKQDGQNKLVNIATNIGDDKTSKTAEKINRDTEKGHEAETEKAQKSFESRQSFVTGQKNPQKTNETCRVSSGPQLGTMKTSLNLDKGIALTNTTHKLTNNTADKNRQTAELSRTVTDKFRKPDDCLYNDNRMANPNRADSETKQQFLETGASAIGRKNLQIINDTYRPSSGAAVEAAKTHTVLNSKADLTDKTPRLISNAVYGNRETARKTNAALKLHGGLSSEIRKPNNIESKEVPVINKADYVINRDAAADKAKEIKTFDQVANATKTVTSDLDNNENVIKEPGSKQKLLENKLTSNEVIKYKRSAEPGVISGRLIVCGWGPTTSVADKVKADIQNKVSDPGSEKAGEGKGESFTDIQNDEAKPNREKMGKTKVVSFIDTIEKVDATTKDSKTEAFENKDVSDKKGTIPTNSRHPFISGRLVLTAENKPSRPCEEIYHDSKTQTLQTEKPAVRTQGTNTNEWLNVPDSEKMLNKSYDLNSPVKTRKLTDRKSSRRQSPKGKLDCVQEQKVTMNINNDSFKLQTVVGNNQNEGNPKSTLSKAKADEDFPDIGMQCVNENSLEELLDLLGESYCQPQKSNKNVSFSKTVQVAPLYRHETVIEKLPSKK